MSLHRSVGTAADTPANDEFFIKEFRKSTWTVLDTTHTQPRLHGTATHHNPAQGFAQKVGGHVPDPRPLLPTPLQGGVTADGFSLIQGHGATRALSGIILGNPASRRGLNTSGASQNKVVRESWVTRAVTQGCATDKLHVQRPLPGTEKHRWRGPGRG